MEIFLGILGIYILSTLIVLLVANRVYKDEFKFAYDLFVYTPILNTLMTVILICCLIFGFIYGIIYNLIKLIK